MQPGKQEQSEMVTEDTWPTQARESHGKGQNAKGEGLRMPELRGLRGMLRRLREDN